MLLLSCELHFFVALSSCIRRSFVALSSCVLRPASCVGRPYAGPYAQMGSFIGIPRKTRATLVRDLEDAGRRTQDAGRENRQEAYRIKNKRKICRSDTVHRVTVAMEISS